MIKCGNCKNGHSSVAEVRACYQGQGVPAHFAQGNAEMDYREGIERQRSAYRRSAVTTTEAREVPGITQPQVDFLTSLLDQREFSNATPEQERQIATIRLGLLNGSLGKYAASGHINFLKGFPRKAQVTREKANAAGQPAPTRAVITQDGMYRNPETGEIFKVQWNRASGDGRALYAKRMHLVYFNGEENTDTTSIPLQDNGQVNFRESHVTFRYAPGAVRTLRPEWRMTIEQARAFGALYGTCLRCNRTLTREESIERSMGPVCAGRANWA